MSVSSIYGQNPTITAAAGSTGFGQSRFQQIQQQFSALGNALSTGNLSAAQTAFSSLQSLQPQAFGQAMTQATSTTQSASGTQSGQNPFQAALAALGKSLANGDITGAQSAFGQLQAAAKTQGTGHHHHHHGGGAEGTTQSSTSQTPQIMPTTSTFQTSA